MVNNSNGSSSNNNWSDDNHGLSSNNNRIPFINIYGFEQLNDFINENLAIGNIVMLYFGAVWCGPCEDLKNKLSKSMTKEIMSKLVVGYLDIDAESNDAIIKKYNVSSIPTQIFMESNDKLKKIIGNDFTKLKQTYNEML